MSIFPNLITIDLFFMTHVVVGGHINAEIAPEFKNFKRNIRFKDNLIS